MSQFNRKNPVGERTKSSKTVQQEMDILKRVKDIFGDRFEDDVIKLILEECMWNETEAVEKLLQLDTDESPGYSNIPIGLDIIACGFLESADDTPTQPTFPDTSEAGIGSQDGSSSRIAVEKQLSTGGITYDYESFSQPTGMWSLPSNCTTGNVPAHFDVELSNSLHSPDVGQRRSTDSDLNLDKAAGFHQPDLHKTGTADKVLPFTVTQSSPLTDAARGSDLVGNERQGQERDSSPTLDATVVSACEKSAVKSGASLAEVLSSSAGLTVPVSKSAYTGHFATETKSVTVERSSPSQTSSSPSRTPANMALSADAPEFKPSFVHTAVPLPASKPPQFYVPKWYDQNRPILPHPQRGGDGKNVTVPDNLSSLLSPLPVQRGKMSYELGRQDYKPRYPATAGNTRPDWFVGGSLYQSVQPPGFPSSYGYGKPAVRPSPPPGYAAAGRYSTALRATPATQTTALTTASSQGSPAPSRQTGLSHVDDAVLDKSPALQKVEQHIEAGEKLLVLMRGLPGSGKSHLARQIQGGGQIFSTDDFFMDGGVYSYDQRDLSAAHEWNQKRVQRALDTEVTPVIVDNTNIAMWEMAQYAAMAYTRGYTVEILEPNTPWSFQPKRLAKCNVHRVPVDTIKRMKDRYETVDTASLMTHVQRKMQNRLPRPAAQKAAPQVNDSAKRNHSTSSSLQGPQSGMKPLPRMAQSQTNQATRQQPKGAAEKNKKKSRKEFIAIRDHCIELQKEGSSEEEIDAWIFMAKLTKDEVKLIKDELRNHKNNESGNIKTDDVVDINRKTVTRDFAKTSKLSHKSNITARSEKDVNYTSVSETGHLHNQYIASSSGVSVKNVKGSGGVSSERSLDPLSWDKPQPQRTRPAQAVGRSDSQTEDSKTAIMSPTSAGSSTVPQEAASWENPMPRRRERSARSNKSQQSKDTGNSEAALDTKVSSDKSLNDEAVAITAGGRVEEGGGSLDLGDGAEAGGDSEWRLATDRESRVTSSSDRHSSTCSDSASDMLTFSDVDDCQVVSAQGDEDMKGCGPRTKEWELQPSVVTSPVKSNETMPGLSLSREVAEPADSAVLQSPADSIETERNPVDEYRTDPSKEETEDAGGPSADGRDNMEPAGVTEVCSESVLLKNVIDSGDVELAAQHKPHKEVSVSGAESQTIAVPDSVTSLREEPQTPSRENVRQTSALSELPDSAVSSEQKEAVQVEQLPQLAEDMDDKTPEETRLTESVDGNEDSAAEEGLQGKSGLSPQDKEEEPLLKGKVEERTDPGKVVASKETEQLEETTGRVAGTGPSVDTEPAGTQNTTQDSGAQSSPCVSDLHPPQHGQGPEETEFPIPGSAGETEFPIPGSAGETEFPIPGSAGETEFPIPGSAGETEFPIPGSAGVREGSGPEKPAAVRADREALAGVSVGERQQSSGTHGRADLSEASASAAESKVSSSTGADDSNADSNDGADDAAHSSFGRLVSLVDYSSSDGESSEEVDLSPAAPALRAAESDSPESSCEGSRSLTPDPQSTDTATESSSTRVVRSECNRSLSPEVKPASVQLAGTPSKSAGASISEDSRSVSPEVQGSYGGSAENSESSCPASPRRKVRRKKHKPPFQPFFDDGVKMKLNADSWSNFIPEKQIADTAVRGGTDEEKGQGSITEQRSVSNYVSVSTQTEGRDFGIASKGSADLEDGYVIRVANKNYTCVSSTETARSLSKMQGPKVTYDKSTVVDIVEEPTVDWLYGMFPGVATAHLNEVLEVCHGDVTMAMELMLEWGITTPLTPHDKRQLSKETTSPRAGQREGGGSEGRGKRSPPRLVDLCARLVPDSASVQQHIINSSQQRLQCIESTEYERLRSISLEEAGTGSGYGLDLRQLSLDVFSASKRETVSSSEAQSETDKSDSSKESSVRGSAIDLLSMVTEGRSMKQKNKEVKPVRTKPQSVPRTSRSDSALRSHTAPRATDHAGAGGQSEGDLALALPARLIYNLEQLFGPLPLPDRSAESWTVHLDHGAAHRLYQCLAHSLSSQHSASVSREDRIRQVQEDEALAQWLQEEDEVDRTLQSISGNPGNTDGLLPHGYYQPTPGGVDVMVHHRPASLHFRPGAHPVNLQDIMDEELARQQHQAKQLKLLEASGDHIAIATKLKREKLRKHFPGVDERVLEEIFQANGYCLESTVSVISTALGGKHPVSHKLEMSARGSSDLKAAVEEEFTIEAVKQLSLQDMSLPERSDQFQRVDALDGPDLNYQELRQEALLHHYMRRDCFTKAHEHHRKGMAQVADFYSKQGHAHTIKMKEANMRASERLLEARHEKLEQEMTLDLHGFHVDEAIAAMKRVIEEKEQVFHMKPVQNRQHLYIITGRGKHSQHGVAKLRPAIIAHLDATGYKYVETKPGLLKVTLHPPS